MSTTVEVRDLRELVRLGCPVGTKDLAQWFGVSHLTITAWIKSGRLPQPVRMTQKRCYWRAEVIADLLEGPGDASLSRDDRGRCRMESGV